MTTTTAPQTSTNSSQIMLEFTHFNLPLPAAGQSVTLTESNLSVNYAALGLTASDIPITVSGNNENNYVHQPQANPILPRVPITEFSLQDLIDGDVLLYRSDNNTPPDFTFNATTTDGSGGTATKTFSFNPTTAATSVSATDTTASAATSSTSKSTATSSASDSVSNPTVSASASISNAFNSTSAPVTTTTNNPIVPVTTNAGTVTTTTTTTTAANNGNTNNSSNSGNDTNATASSSSGAWNNLYLIPITVLVAAMFYALLRYYLSHNTTERMKRMLGAPDSSKDDQVKPINDIVALNKALVSAIMGPNKGVDHFSNLRNTFFGYSNDPDLLGVKRELDALIKAATNNVNMHVFNLNTGKNLSAFAEEFTNTILTQRPSLLQRPQGHRIDADLFADPENQQIQLSIATWLKDKSYYQASVVPIGAVTTTAANQRPLPDPPAPAEHLRKEPDYDVIGFSNAGTPTRSANDSLSSSNTHSASGSSSGLSRDVFLPGQPHETSNPTFGADNESLNSESYCVPALPRHQAVDDDGGGAYDEPIFRDNSQTTASAVYGDLSAAHSSSNLSRSQPSGSNINPFYSRASAAPSTSVKTKYDSLPTAESRGLSSQSSNSSSNQTEESRKPYLKRVNSTLLARLDPNQFSEVSKNQNNIRKAETEAQRQALLTALLFPEQESNTGSDERGTKVDYLTIANDTTPQPEKAVQPTRSSFHR